MSGNGQPSSPARPPDPVTGRCLPAGLAERALTTKKMGPPSSPTAGPFISCDKCGSGRMGTPAPTLMPSPWHLCCASLDSVTAPQFIPRPDTQRALSKQGRRDTPSLDRHPMAAQFIDLAREITRSPFPNQLRSVTWQSGSPLVGVSHEPDQSHRESAAGWRLKFRGGSFAGECHSQYLRCLSIQW